MTDRSIYVSRLVRLPFLDAEGAPMGRVDDLVVAPSRPTEPPVVLGFVVLVDRRRIFVGGNRVSEIDPSGVRLVRGSLDFRRFRQRAGELLVREDLFGQRVGGEVVNDLAIVPAARASRAWVVSTVALASTGLLRRRRTGRTVPWSEVINLFDTGGHLAREVAAFRDLHPADVASRISRLPLAQRRQLAEAMDDTELADLLEELPEDEQVRLIANLDTERVVDVLEEMEADDAADLLAELPADRQAELLEAMEPEEADDMRRLLSYEPDSAGGLMNPEPLILTPNVTVAEAMARIRELDVPQVLGANVFVVEPPTETPTGRYLGIVGFQRLMRVPPSSPIGEVVEDEPEPVRPDLPQAEVANRLATYDGLALPVCDAAGRLLGAITVDDVLDRLLPADWRRWNGREAASTARRDR